MDLACYASNTLWELERVGDHLACYIIPARFDGPAVINYTTQFEFLELPLHVELTVDVFISGIFQAETDHLICSRHNLRCINVAEERVPRIPT